MGRIKGSHIKRIANQLVEKTSLFSLDMKKNKEELKKLGILPSSKRERNKLSARITTLSKRKEKQNAKTKTTAATQPVA